MKTRLFAAALLAAGLLAACAPAAPASAPIAVTVQVFQMAYNPATLELTAGQPVELTFQNNDVVDHDFSIQDFPMRDVSATQEPLEGHDMSDVHDEPELHISALQGTSHALTFTPTTAGTYEYFCTVPGHKDAGVRGTLTVTAP